MVGFNLPSAFTPAQMKPADASAPAQKYSLDELKSVCLEHPHPDVATL